MSESSSVTQLRLRFVQGGDIALGPGKVELLEAVGRHGSISGAARSMEMSYRRAWLLINIMNRCFSGPLVHTSRGGEAKGGAALTALGREVLQRYRRIERTMREAAREDLAVMEGLLEVKGEGRR